jgi:repressor LexA
MKNAGILDGDMVIVRKQPVADNGEIVVALIGEEATCKRLSNKDGEIWLLPENEAYEPIDGTEASIVGKVTAVIRTY